LSCVLTSDYSQAIEGRVSRHISVQEIEPNPNNFVAEFVGHFARQSEEALIDDKQGIFRYKLSIQSSR
jgi:hypothetical protein